MAFRVTDAPVGLVELADTRYIPKCFSQDLVYTKYIPDICLQVDFGIYQVYTRYIPGIYQVWKYMGIHQVYTWYIPPI